MMLRFTVLILLLTWNALACGKERNRAEANGAVDKALIETAYDHDTPERRQAHLNSIEVRILDQGKWPQIKDTDLKEETAATFRKAKMFSEDSSAPKAEVFVLISADSMEVSPGTKSVVITVEGGMRLNNSEDLTLSHHLLWEKPLRGGSKVAQKVGEGMVHAVRMWTDGLIAREKIRMGGVSEAQLALGEKEDPDLVLYTFEEIASRMMEPLFDDVSKLLASPNGPIRRRAVGVLTTLRGREAVPVVTRGVSFNDYEQLRAVIEAVTSVGGEESKIFLSFVANGHSDPDMKARAVLGIERIERIERITAQEAGK